MQWGWFLLPELSIKVQVTFQRAPVRLWQASAPRHRERNLFTKILTMAPRTEPERWSHGSCSYKKEDMPRNNLNIRRQRRQRGNNVVVARPRCHRLNRSKRQRRPGSGQSKAVEPFKVEPSARGHPVVNRHNRR